MAKGGRKTIALTAANRELLEALWKWKLLDTESITKAFFPNRHPKTTYHRLLRLRNLGLVSDTHLRDKRFAWSLTKRGFAQIQHSLPQGTNESFKSESPYHDWLVSRTHAGEWLRATPATYDLFSEQELRSISVATYPSWIPHTELHRPDGYWQIVLKGNWCTIALEVELTQKEASEYRKVARFYRDRQQVFRIVWVTENLSLARKIQAEIESEVGANHKIHDFLLAEDVKHRGWEATFILGSKAGRTLGSWLKSGVLLSSSPGTTTGQFAIPKNSVPSSPYSTSHETSISDRLALSASPASTNFSPAIPNSPLTNQPSDSLLVQEPLLTRTGVKTNE